MPDFAASQYRPETHEALLASWWESHARSDAHFDPKLLSSWGAVVERGGEPIAALFLYAAPPVGFLEQAVTRPGLKPAEASYALLFASEILRETARWLGCAGLVAYPPAAIARRLARSQPPWGLRARHSVRHSVSCFLPI